MKDTARHQDSYATGWRWWQTKLLSTPSLPQVTTVGLQPPQGCRWLAIAWTPRWDAYAAGGTGLQWNPSSVDGLPWWSHLQQMTSAVVVMATRVRSFTSSSSRALLVVSWCISRCWWREEARVILGRPDERHKPSRAINTFHAHNDWYKPQKQLLLLHTCLSFLLCLEFWLYILWCNST